MSYKHILIPLDGSKLAASAIPLGRALAKTSGAKVWLLHIVPKEGVVSRPLTPSERKQFADISIYLKERKAGLEDEEIEAHWSVTVGDPLLAIARLAEEEKVDLVVMSTHGEGANSDNPFGSVAEAVLNSTRIPLMLLRATPGRRRAIQPLPWKVMIPLDGSQLSEEALTHLESWRREGIEQVILAHVVSPARKTRQEARKTLISSEAEVYLQGRQRRLSTRSVLNAQVLLFGDPGEELVKYARKEKIGVIIMTSHGMGGITQSAYGSVAGKVLRSSQTPLLLVPSEKSRK